MVNEAAATTTHQGGGRWGWLVITHSLHAEIAWFIALQEHREMKNKPEENKAHDNKKTIYKNIPNMLLMDQLLKLSLF